MMAFMRLSRVFCAAGLALATPLTAQTPEGNSVPETVSLPTSPPIAELRDHSYTCHGITIADPYNWLHDKSYPTVDDTDVLAYLNAENAWFEAQMKPQQTLVDTLFEEMKARIKEDDSTVPQRSGKFLYWSEFEQGAEYRKYYRKPLAGGDPQLILDENALAEGKEYFRLGAFSVSNNGRYLAYSADDNGSERFDVHIKDLETGELLPDTIPGTLSGLVWVMQDRGLVYGVANDNWRVHDATLHVLGTPVSQDVELYRETRDDGFRVGAGISAQEDWLVIATGDNETSEVRLVRADDPTGEQIVVAPRRKGVEYDVDIRDGKVFVLTNDEHVNFRLATADLATPGEWTTLIASTRSRSATMPTPRWSSRSPLPKPASTRVSRTIPNTTRTSCACPTRAWSPPTRFMTTMSPAANWNCSSSRKSPADTMSISTRQSAWKSPRVTARWSRSAS